MAFLRIDGYAIEAILDSFSLEDDSVESYGRGALDEQLEGLTYAKKRSLSFETPPLALEDALALEGWVRGDGHRWSFARQVTTPTGVTTTFTRTSADAGYSMTSASGFGSTVSPLWGNQAFSLGLFPGDTATATLRFGSEGDWTIHGYHIANGDGPWRSFATKSYAGTVRYYVNGASVGSVPFMTHSVASGYLGVVLQGETSSGATAQAQYAAFSVDRFAWNEDMLASAASVAFGLASTGFARRPFVTVTGDALQGRFVPCNGAGENGPMVAKGFTKSFNVKPVTVDGVFRYNARSLAIMLQEK
jgi:hypothetical protein